MHTRPFHGLDRPVSALGLGTVKLGRNESVKYPEPFDLPSDDAVLSLLDLAQEQGINLLDTAPAYGSSEERLGALLGARRDQWIIVSKAGEEFESGHSHFDFSHQAVTYSIDRTLTRLRTDRIECLLLHSDGRDLDVLDHSDALVALAEAKEKGKILTAGISTKTVEGGIRAIELSLDAVMITYNPWYRDEEAVLDAAARDGKTNIFLKKAFGSGWFGSKDETTSTEDPIATALRFVFAHPATTAAIIGTLNPRHLVQNCHALREALVGM